jgi:hypothetical protein
VDRACERRQNHTCREQDNGLVRAAPGYSGSKSPRFLMGIQPRVEPKFPFLVVGVSGTFSGGGPHGQANRRTAAAHLLGRVRRGHHVRRNPAPLKKQSSRWGMRARCPPLPTRRTGGCGAERLRRLRSAPGLSVLKRVSGLQRKKPRAERGLGLGASVVHLSTTDVLDELNT